MFKTTIGIVDTVRSMFRRILVLCVLVCSLGLSLSGCCVAELTYEPVTITFSYVVSGFYSETEYFEQVREEFNEIYPYITVELETENLGGAGGFNPGEADVFFASWFNLMGLQGQGAVMSLGPFIEDEESLDLSDFYAEALNAFQSEGQTWAIPAGIDVPVVFYNQDLFAQYGVAYPDTDWTWEDFQAAGLAIRDPGAEIFGYVPTLYPIDLLLFVYQHDGQIYDDAGGFIEPTFDHPLTVEAVEWYADLIHEYNIVPTPAQLRGQEYGTAVLQGRVGMWTGWLSSRGGEDWPVEWDMRWGVVPFPRDAQSATLIFVDGYAISSQTPHPDACWRWITFLSEHERPSFSVIPPRRSWAESDAFEDLVGSDVAAAGRASVESDMSLAPIDTSAMFAEPGMFSTFVRAVDQVVRGLATPEEALTRAQEQVER